MKRLENFTREDLWKLRTEVAVGSMYYSDYNNSFGLDTHSVSDFFEGWLDFCEELMEEDGKDKPRDNFFEYFVGYDNADTLEQWYYCYDNFDWVKYPEERKKIEAAYYSAVDYICGDAASARDVIDEAYDAICNTPALKDLAEKLVHHINWWGEDTLSEHITEADILVEEISGFLAEWLENNTNI